MIISASSSTRLLSRCSVLVLPAATRFVVCSAATLIEWVARIVDIVSVCTLHVGVLSQHGAVVMKRQVVLQPSEQGKEERDDKERKGKKKDECVTLYYTNSLPHIVEH